MPNVNQWQQTVRIANQTAYVRGLNVSTESRAPITKISFSVDAEPATQPTFDLLALNEIVEVTHSDDGPAPDRTWRALITTISLERGRNYTQAKVECETLETRAKRVRIFGEYAGTLTDVVTQIWNEWGTSLAANVDALADSTEVEIKPAYDSLFSVIDELARRFDYAWEIDDAADTFRFFDPFDKQATDIVQADGDLIGSSLTLTQSAEDIVNSVLAAGWIYRTISQTAEADARTVFGFLEPKKCVYRFHSDQAERLLNLDDWELVSTRIVEDTGDPSEPREVELVDNGWFRVDPILVEGKVKVEATFRRLAQTVVEDQASIDAFGRREGEPITEDGGQTLEESRQRANIVVDARAWPAIEADLELSRMGPIADEAVRLTLYDPALDRLMFVDSAEQSVSGNEMEVTVKLSSDDSPDGA